MQIRWGNAFLEVDGAIMATAKRTVENAANVPYEMQVIASIEGWWTGTTPQLVAKCAAFENALAVPFKDLVLAGDDGSIIQRLANAGSTTGTRCLEGPDYPRNTGAELVNYRYYRFSITANYPLGTGPILLDYLETVETSGTGPVTDFQLPAKGPPIPVQLYSATPGRMTQQGYAVTQGLSPVSYATPPNPLFPSSLLVAPTFKRSAKRSGAQKWECRVEWAYSMGAIGALTGLPNAWR